MNIIEDYKLYRSFGTYYTPARAIKAVANRCISKFKLLFYKIPLVARILAQRVDVAVHEEKDYVGPLPPARLYIPRIKHARRLTGMGLRDSKQWVDAYFGK